MTTRGGVSAIGPNRHDRTAVSRFERGLHEALRPPSVRGPQRWLRGAAHRVEEVADERLVTLVDLAHLHGVDAWHAVDDNRSVIVEDDRSAAAIDLDPLLAGGAGP